MDKQAGKKVETLRVTKGESMRAAQVSDLDQAQEEVRKADVECPFC